MTDVQVRMLNDMHDMVAAENLMMRVWGCGRDGVPFLASTMRALRHADNYVSGAFLASAPDEMIGCTAGFFGPPAAAMLHSHAAAVDATYVGAGIGTAMKFHQRDWCLERGTTSIDWTYDPLIARNAYFNLESLGAVPTEHLVDFYGPMEDEINRGQPSDRLLASWDLTQPDRRTHRAERRAWRERVVSAGEVALSVGPAGEPITHPAAADANTLLFAIPADIERMRVELPDLAARWRYALRAALDALFASSSHHITGFDPQAGYIAERVS